MTHLGNALRSIRLQRALTLKDVERITAGHVSVAWLTRLEKEGIELDTDKLGILARIYALTPGELVDSIVHEGIWVVPERTTLILPKVSALSGPYRWGILGKQDRTLEPLIPAGTVVQIDARESQVVQASTHPIQPHNPIYFLRHGSHFSCGWCELDGRRIRLLPHPFSPVVAHGWKDRDELEIVGRVIRVISPHGLNDQIHRLTQTRAAVISGSGF
jgi:transcriptional regulator with XRE-family HTH domain